MLTTNLIKSVGQVDIEFGLETFGPTRCSQTLGRPKLCLEEVARQVAVKIIKSLLIRQFLFSSPSRTTVAVQRKADGFIYNVIIASDGDPPCCLEKINKKPELSRLI